MRSLWCTSCRTYRVYVRLLAQSHTSTCKAMTNPTATTVTRISILNHGEWGREFGGVAELEADGEADRGEYWGRAVVRYSDGSVIVFESDPEFGWSDDAGGVISRYLSDALPGGR